MGDLHSMSQFKTPDPDRRNLAGGKLNEVVLKPDKLHYSSLSSITNRSISNIKNDCFSSSHISTSSAATNDDNDYDYINSTTTPSASLISSASRTSLSSTVRDSRRKKLVLYNHQHQNNNNWSKMIIVKKKESSSSSSSSSLFRRRRDPNLMGSCETSRTIIDPDTTTSTRSGDDIVVVSSCSIRNKLNHNRSDNNNNNNNPSSNYKSCTELFTTTMWKLVVIMKMMMTTTLTLTISKFHQRHQQQQQRQTLHYNYNLHRHNRVNSNCLRTFIVSVILCLLSCSNTPPTVHGQPPPLPPAGFLDFDNLPVTRFSCEGKVIGGYYADVETGCQMFHVCTLGQKDEIQDIKFLCLNGTVFDQETRVCERVDEVDCSKAEQFFDLNLDLYVSHATTQKPEEADLEEEDDVIRPVQAAAGSKSKISVPSPTTRQTTTTTTTPTPSPRTRPPTPPIISRSRTPPVISSSASSRQQQQQQQQQSSSSQQEDEEDEDDGRSNGNNAYTSFNYYLKTPHSHVASGYNSQSRQSYIINQPSNNNGRGGTGGSGSSGPNSSGSSPNAVATAAVTSTGRKVPSGSAQKTIVYSSTSTSSSSTQRPKTVVVVKATLAPSKSILRPKTLATPRTTTTTPVPPSKYELDDQYDEYYDEEDYPVEQQPPPPPSKSTSFHQTYPMSKPALISGSTSTRGGYDFRDGRSTKGVANAGQTIISSSTGRSPLDRGKVSIAITSKAPKVTTKPVLVSPANIKVISSEFVGNNSTEEPYYYEDDYPDDAAFHQQQQYANAGYSSTSPSGPSKSPISSPTPTRGINIIRGSPPPSLIRGPTTLQQAKVKQQQQQQQEDVTKEKDVSSSDYYDDDNENVNAHDHHFTHVDVPRIPFAKPNVPRVLVTNGKPFLPRLRRQSHYHHNNNYFAPNPFPPPPQPRQSFIRDLLLPAAASTYPRPYQRPNAPLLQNNYHHRPPGPVPIPAGPGNGALNPMELRREARAKAIQWGRDPRPFSR